jgi:hypothetical protein
VSQPVSQQQARGLDQDLLILRYMKPGVFGYLVDKVHPGITPVEVSLLIYGRGLNGAPQA